MPRHTPASDDVVVCRYGSPILSGRLLAINERRFNQRFAVFGCVPTDSAPRLIFDNRKAKELDSGLVELETPNEPSKFPVNDARPRSSGSDGSGLSTSSSPPALSSSAGRSIASLAAGSVSSSPSVCSIDLAAAHNNAELRRRLEAFQWAQRTYPGNAILFVGNLPALHTDLQLNDEVTDVFSPFGPVYVHIDRSYSREYVKPYALVQLPHATLAIQAFLFCYQTSPCIGGRPLRVERSYAPRTFKIASRDRRLTLPDNLLNAAFGGYGTLSSMRRMVEPDQSRGPLGCVSFGPWGCPDFDTVLLEFECYGSFVDAKQAVQVGEGLCRHFELIDFGVLR